MTRPLNSVFSAGVTQAQARKRTDDAVFSLVALKLAPFRHVHHEQAGALTIDRWQQDTAERTVIDLTSDSGTGVSFVSVMADAAETADQVARKLNLFLMLRPAAEFVDLALSERQNPSALLRAAIASGPDEDARMVAALHAGLAAPSETVRAAAIKASALVGWPSLGSELRKTLDAEQVPELRRYLDIAIRKCAG